MKSPFGQCNLFQYPRDHIAQQAETVQGQRLFLNRDQYILGIIHSSY